MHFANETISCIHQNNMATERNVCLPFDVTATTIKLMEFGTNNF